ncbi:MAG: mechanosensitive ion channel family protein [Gammaproteobacteria bacterium]
MPIRCNKSLVPERRSADNNNEPMKSTQAVRQLILLICFVFSASFLHAAEEPSVEPSETSVNFAQLEELIVTLESETARQEFLDNLRAILSMQDEQSQNRFSFANFLELDTTSNSLLSSYVNFIRGLGFSNTAAGKFIVLGLIVVAITVFIVINNKISHLFTRRLGRLRRKFDFSEKRFLLIFTGQRLAGYALALLLLMYGLLYVISSPDEFQGMRSATSFVAEYTVLGLFLGLLLITSWEGVNAGMEYLVHRSSTTNSARVRTLLPVIRNLIFFAVLLLCSMILLSELGVDIVPLLAGAGVLGIAIGFGAQTMVKDFLTGFTIVLEDLLQVGDVVSVAGRTGLVERITLRKIQLRDLDGTVYTVPHSEVAVVDNLTKEYSFYLLDVGVAYAEDTDRVIECLLKIDEELREDDDFADMILAPLHVLGVDKFDDSAVIVRVRTKTRPHDKWNVGREFNRRIKQTFDKEGIEIPFPHRTIYFGAEERKLEEQAIDNDSEEATSENTRPDKDASAEQPANED